MSDAARAFDDLRAEVAGLRRAVEGFSAAAEEREAPDYAPELGGMRKALGVMADQLAAIEAHPALQETPARHVMAIAAAGREATRGAVQALEQAGRDALQEREQLGKLIGTIDARHVQRRWAWGAGAIGAVLGVLVWYPLVFLVPWGGGHWLAASLIGGGEWQAGATLMQEARPVAWERVVRLNNACPPDRATEACVAAMAARSETVGQGKGPPPSFGSTPRSSRTR